MPRRGSMFTWSTNWVMVCTLSPTTLAYMSLVANGVQLRKILYVDSQYIIPRNQRKYVWTISEIESLYEDIIFNIRKSSAGEDYQHFIGSFIFQKEKENSIVVDGQQRLTTLTILLAVVVKFLRHMGKTTLADTANDMGVQYAMTANAHEFVTKAAKEWFFSP